MRCNHSVCNYVSINLKVIFFQSSHRDFQYFMQFLSTRTKRVHECVAYVRAGHGKRALLKSMPIGRLCDGVNP